MALNSHLSRQKLTFIWKANRHSKSASARADSWEAFNRLNQRKSEDRKKRAKQSSGFVLRSLSGRRL